LRLVTVVILGGEALEGLGIFAGDDLGWASMPVFRAFMRQTAFPAEEVGPVDNCEFRRFASICLRVAIKERSQEPEGKNRTPKPDITVAGEQRASGYRRP
jgi:hypothetical protein